VGAERRPAKLTPPDAAQGGVLGQALQWLLGKTVSPNKGLVPTSTLYTDLPGETHPINEDCRFALPNATAIGFQAEADDVTFCVDDIRLLSNTP